VPDRVAAHRVRGRSEVRGRERRRSLAPPRGGGPRGGPAGPWRCRGSCCSSCSSPAPRRSRAQAARWAEAKMMLSGESLILRACIARWTGRAVGAEAGGAHCQPCLQAARLQIRRRPMPGCEQTRPCPRVRLAARCHGHGQVAPHVQVRCPPGLPRGGLGGGAQDAERVQLRRPKPRPLPRGEGPSVESPAAPPTPQRTDTPHPDNMSREVSQDQVQAVLGQPVGGRRRELPERLLRRPPVGLHIHEAHHLPGAPLPPASNPHLLPRPHFSRTS
jgi:hypothetical protein